MPAHMNYGPNSTHVFVSGIGRVPTGPKSSRSNRSTSDLEEGEILNSSSSSRSSYIHSPYSERNYRYAVASRKSSYHSERYRNYTGSHGISEARTWESWDSRGSHDWYRTVTRREGRYVSRGRERGNSYSSQIRSRSRSPVRVRDPNGNLFSRTGNVLSGPDDPLFPSRALSLCEIPPYVEGLRAPPKTCRCPVSETCPHRRGNSKDCRPPVPTWQSWMKTKPQEFEIV
jgi:hypothetical protein